MGGSVIAVQPEERRLLGCGIVEKLIVAMQIHGHIERALRARPTPVT